MSCELSTKHQYYSSWHNGVHSLAFSRAAYEIEPDEEKAGKEVEEYLWS